jgi:mitochondrial fission protein ELM1
VQRHIWVVSDGKAGHLNQSLGLAEALERLRRSCIISTVDAVSGAAALLRGRPAQLPAPDLLIGAGHGTHLSLLRWRGSARSVVLMRPSLPRRLFDLCIEPRHDGGAEGPRRWLSDGPLNRMRPALQRDDAGLLLIGGPSPHYDWDSGALIAQIADIAAAGGRWVLSTSRRTPRDFLPRLRALQLERLTLHDVAGLPPGWLADTLPRAPRCWVTPDSASMVYEALSAGAAVGLFELPARADSRVARGIADLCRRGLCLGYAAHAAGAALTAPDAPLAEADRLAQRIVERGWL